MCQTERERFCNHWRLLLFLRVDLLTIHDLLLNFHLRMQLAQTLFSISNFPRFFHNEPKMIKYCTLFFWLVSVAVLFSSSAFYWSCHQHVYGVWYLHILRNQHTAYQDHCHFFHYSVFYMQSLGECSFFHRSYLLLQRIFGIIWL